MHIEYSIALCTSHMHFTDISIRWIATVVQNLVAEILTLPQSLP